MGNMENIGSSPPHFHATTMFTSFFGRTMIFRIVLPARNGFTFSEPWAAASNSAGWRRGHADHVAELAVHLNGDFEGVLDQQGRVEAGQGA